MSHLLRPTRFHYACYSIVKEPSRADLKRGAVVEHRVVKLVGLGRFELPASSLSGMRSNQLSYKPTARSCLGSSGTRLPGRSLKRIILAGRTRLRQQSDYAVAGIALRFASDEAWWR